jgi:hypothetical protein
MSELRLSPTAAALIVALVPLPAVLALGSQALQPGLSDPLFATALAAFSSAFLVLTLRKSKPQYSIGRGSASWSLVAVLGFCLYLLGSFLGEHLLQWAALPPVYLGLAACLGGKRFASHLIPSVLIIALLPLQAFLDPTLVEGGTGLTFGLAVFSAALAVRFRPPRQEMCAYCKTYDLQGRSFCDHCGVRLSRPFEVMIPGRRVLTMGAAVLAVVLLLGVTLPVLSLSGTGLHIADYGLSGGSKFSSLPAAPGWTSSFKGHASDSNATTFDYILTDGTNDVNATLALSRTPGLSELAATGGYLNATQDGVLLPPGGSSGAQFSFTDGGKSYSGLLVSSDANYLLVGEAQQAYASYFFAWPSSVPSTVVAYGIVPLADASTVDLARAGQTGSIVVWFFSLVQTNELIALGLCAAALFTAIGGVATNIDRSSRRRFDNSLGVDEKEFAILESMSARKSSETGKAILRTCGLEHDWSALSPILEKLERYGLLEREVATADGIPKIFWKSKVAWP